MAVLEGKAAALPETSPTLDAIGAKQGKGKKIDTTDS
jgi:hypothetical protein